MRSNVIALFTLLTALADANCAHGTPKWKRANKGKTVEVNNFGYTNMEGPLNWAGIEEENKMCATGKFQSPINLDADVAEASEAPKVNIANVEEAEFENLGTTVEVIHNGTTTFEGKDYTLAQFHLHTPSEHRIDDEYFPLEMHMVHEAADDSGDILVLAALFEMCSGEEGTALIKSVADSVQKVAEPGSVSATGPLDFAPVVEHFQTTPLKQYSGSLTTPPCDEGITFLVTEEPMPVDVNSFKAIKKVIKFNSRYTQNKLGDRNLLGLPMNVAHAAESFAEEWAQVGEAARKVNA